MCECNYEIPKSVQELIHMLVSDVMKSGKQGISIDITSAGPCVRIYPYDDAPYEENDMHEEG